jgi:hypothetical protein
MADEKPIDLTREEIEARERAANAAATQPKPADRKSDTLVQEEAQQELASVHDR